MDSLIGSPRRRSDSLSSTTSQGSKSKMQLRQRLFQLLSRIEDMSSEDEASEEVSRSLDDAFQLCGCLMPTDSFRLTHVWLEETFTDIDNIHLVYSPVYFLLFMSFATRPGSVNLKHWFWMILPPKILTQSHKPCSVDNLFMFELQAIIHFNTLAYSTQYVTVTVTWG